MSVACADAKNLPSFPVDVNICRTVDLRVPIKELYWEGEVSPAVTPMGAFCCAPQFLSQNGRPNT